MNLRQWRKAYMIEFLKNDNEVEDVFTFSVPPESESLKFPQRITETPTMGGIVFDDYGNDTVKIRLTGSTINEEKKLIYQGNKKLPDYLTGEKEIFRLQELFEKWGSLEYENFTSKKIYLYDLSKMNLLQIGAGSPARNYWRIINKGLEIKRAKDKPYTFLYDLELTGIVDKPGVIPPLFDDGFGKFLDGCQKAVAIIEKVAEVTEIVADTIDTLTQQIVDVKKFVEKLQNGDALHGVEAVMRKFPGGNSLWNATKAMMGTASKLQYLTRTSTSQVTGGTRYSRSDSFMVVFNSGAGSYVAPIRAAYGDYAEKPADPILKNFKFLGWYTAQGESGELFVFEATEIVKRITLYARWERIQATVTFNSRQGSAVVPATVDIGATAAAPEPPARQGYEFEYWCTDSAATVQFDFNTPIKNDLTLYARWRAAYTITFDSNGGSAVPPQGGNAGGKIIYPAIPEKENHLFGMWCVDPSLNTEFDFNTPISGNITLYAKWTRVTNTVTFNPNGGSAVPPQGVKIGGHAVKPPDPTKEGCNFEGWYSDTELTQIFDFSTQINYPAIIYAKWSIKILTVNFNSEGGTPVESQEIEYRKLAVYPITPTKEGCLFVHWSIIEMVENTIEVENEETGEMEEVSETVETRKKYDFSAPVVEDLTLYANWHEGAGV